MTFSKILSSGVAACAIAGMTACSAGVADLGTQQRELRAAVAPALQSGATCVTAWVHQRDVSMAAVNGQGDRAGATTAVNEAKTACDAAAAAMGGITTPVVVNPANQALLRTAYTACQGAYTAVSAQLTAKAALLGSSATDWSSPATDAAVNAAMSSMSGCETSWNAAMSAMQITDVQAPVLSPSAPSASGAAATGATAPATPAADTAAPAATAPAATATDAAPPATSADSTASTAAN